VTRQTYLEQATKVVLTPVKVETPTITQAIADPQARVFAQLGNWIDGGKITDDVDPKKIELTELKLIFMISALVVGVKVMAFFFASAVWPKAAAAKIETKGEKERADPAPSPAVEKSAEPPQPSATIIDHPKKTEAEAQPGVTDISRARERKIVEEFFADEVVLGKGGRAKAATVYQWFADWSKRSKYPLISNSQFGRICTELQIERTTDGRHNFYAVQRRQGQAFKKVA
jgi:hypothetical protein